jgi:peroxiredoxin
MKWRSLDESRPDTGVRSLREIYAERKQLISKYVPADIQAIHSRVVEELRQAGIADRALQAGDHVRGFELPDHTAKVVRSSDLVRNGPLVICFYRGRWCPFCVGQLEAMNQQLEALRYLGASLVGISPQSVKHSFFMADQHRLHFPLLSDPSSHVARQFGLVYTAPEYQQHIYRQTFVNLPAISGQPGWELPIPATYVLAKLGEGDSESHTIVYAVRNPDYTDRAEPNEVVRFLREHLSSF